MRTDANPGPWEIHGGLWTTTTDQNADMGTNPFCYKCDGSQGVATALAGQEFWGEYRFTCAVQPGKRSDGGQVGIGWLATSPGDMYLFTADVRQGFQPRPNGCGSCGCTMANRRCWRPGTAV
ncbi:MAG: hypothetical protein M5U09_18150 [Gammaproteobacteria bacterium]|nr:hypothetical protein [Gammaproteobacteria bacterium]